MRLQCELTIKEKNKKGEGRFSFTFLRREISPAFKGAARSCYIKINLLQVRVNYNRKQQNSWKIMHSESTIRYAISLFLSLVVLPFPGTFRLVRNNQQDIPQRIVALHENPGILCIYLA